MNTRTALPYALTLLATSTLMSATVNAQADLNRTNLYLGALHFSFDADHNQDDDTGYYLGLEIPATERWSGVFEMWEADSDHTILGTESDVDYRRIGGNYHLNAVSQWQPYLSAGLGFLDIEPSGPIPDLDETAFDMGIGVKRLLGENFLFRGDAKSIFVTDTHDWDFALGLSVGYMFGSGSSPAPRRTAATPMDSDGDGVFDDVDNCRNTPAGTAVDERGCELDSDRDGVVDSRDNCPDTSMELAVDANGCPILETSMMRQELLINFDFDRSEIKPEYSDEVSDFAGFMRQYTNTSVTIEGHTDSVGTEDYNQGLSERRANAVRDALVQEHDIPADRLSTVGYGESRPVDTNDTPAGRERNRRIEAEVSVEVEEQLRR